MSEKKEPGNGMNRTAYTEEMKRCLEEQEERHPLMNEDDIVKFAFQGMLGVGHLIRSEAEVLTWLQKEMDSMEPDPEEPLTEKISPAWCRVNLRAAKARGITAEELAARMIRSVRIGPLSFVRQDVYDFYISLDSSEKMKAAAEKVLKEDWLPGHSNQYREAYYPAYRVMHRDVLEPWKEKK